MIEKFDGVTFNNGILLTALIVLLLFGTVFKGNVEPESEPQQTLI